MAKRKARIISLRPQAQRDLGAIAKKIPKATERILDKIELLLDFPEIGPAMDQAYQGYRHLVCGNYYVIYQIISSDRIEIAYIRHAARQLGLRAVQ